MESLRLVRVWYLHGFVGIGMFSKDAKRFCFTFGFALSVCVCVCVVSVDELIHAIPTANKGDRQKVRRCWETIVNCRSK